jgi:hypothetical protein
MSTADNPVQVGDLVTISGREPDVWQVLEVRRGAARLVARSTHLSETLRWVEHEKLNRYAPPDDET